MRGEKDRERDIERRRDREKDREKKGIWKLWSDLTYKGDKKRLPSVSSRKIHELKRYWVSKNQAFDIDKLLENCTKIIWVAVT